MVTKEDILKEINKAVAIVLNNDADQITNEHLQIITFALGAANGFIKRQEIEDGEELPGTETMGDSFEDRDTVIFGVVTKSDRRSRWTNALYCFKTDNSYEPYWIASGNNYYSKESALEDCRRMLKWMTLEHYAYEIKRSGPDYGDRIPKNPDIPLK